MKLGKGLEKHPEERDDRGDRGEDDDGEHGSLGVPDEQYAEHGRAGVR